MGAAIRPAAMSAATISRMKSPRSTASAGGVGGAGELGLLWLVIATPATGTGGVAAHGDGAPHSPGSWLARQDSNLEPPDPESGALPLSHAPATVRSLPERFV